METLRMRIAKQGRGGKTMTVIDGFTREKRLMERLASDLKRKLAIGGSFHERALYLQGDVRDRVRLLLLEMGFKING